MRARIATLFSVTVLSVTVLSVTVLSVTVLSVTVLSVTVLSACGPRAEEPAPPARDPSAVRAPSEEPIDEPMLDEEEMPAPPSLDDAQLDAMDRPDLEAACYAGSSAACDRLGH
ncbi:MAG: hypothetical protein M3Y87_35320 [Myxococcota bacterium]|nr:hypothetical protein [Myxococcota bacterium]